MSNSTLWDPNYLVLIARGLDEANGVEQRHTARLLIQDSNIRRQAAILDSIAYVSVSQAQNQIIAVAAQLDLNEGVTILVTENRTLPGVVEHLQDIFARLERIRTQARLQNEPPLMRRYISFPPTNDFDRELLELEVSIIKHSWKKLRQRVTKNARHQNLIDTATDVCGLPVDQRTSELGHAECALLRRLQASTALTSEDLLSAADGAQKLAKVLGLEVSDERARSVRPLLEGLSVLERALKGSEDFLQTWNQYTRYRLLSKGTHVPKDPDLYHWLSKVASIREHYLCIADVATSRTLANILLRGVRVQRVANPVPRAVPISLDRQGLEKILVTAGCELGDMDHRQVDDFLEMLSSAHPGAIFEAGKLSIDYSREYHCESHLLAKYHNCPLIPYIGVSKLSCVYCHMYFASYREATGSEICTRGTHGQTSKWLCPVLADVSLESKIRENIIETLLQRIKKGWIQYRRSFLASQGTSASGQKHRYEQYRELREVLAKDREQYTY